MSENNIPATEALLGTVDERSQYELAFHILPTVAEEEVPAVFGSIKTLIDSSDGTIIHEEAPLRFDLAYEVVKHTEGRNFRYNHSYFGWVRFVIEGDKLEHLKAEIEHEGHVLRYVILKLSKADIEQPFRVFDVRRKERKTADAVQGEKSAETPKPVSEEDITRSLEQITS